VEHSFVQFFARTGLCLSLELQQLKIELDPLLPTLFTKDLIQTRPSWIVNNAAASLAVRVDEHRGQRFVSIPTVPWGKKARIPQAKRQREWDGRHSHTEYAKDKSRLRVTLGGKVANASGPTDFCTNDLPHFMDVANTA